MKGAGAVEGHTVEQAARVFNIVCIVERQAWKMGVFQAI